MVDEATRLQVSMDTTPSNQLNTIKCTSIITMTPTPDSYLAAHFYASSHTQEPTSHPAVRAPTTISTILLVMYQECTRRKRFGS